MLRKASLLMLMALLLSAGARPSLADDASLGRSGETVFPVGEPAVRMAAEEVLLKVDPERTEVDLTFTLTNAGPAKTVLMGFPLKEQFEGRGHPELGDFRTLVDGVATPVQTEAAGSGDYPGWITWPVDFAANQTRVVQNSYWGTNSYWSNGETMAGYILKTGAAWQSTIGDAVVRAKLDHLLPPDLAEATPADYHWQGDDLVWEWRDFEPAHDIALRWNPRAWQFPVLNAMPNAGVGVSFPPGPALDGLVQWRQEHPNTTGKPDDIDLVLLRVQYAQGDHATVKKGVQQALDAGLQAPLVAYLAVAEGLRQPAEVLGWPDLRAPLRRWLQDRAGIAGAPPAMPVLRLTDGLNLAVAMADPDGDITDWGLKVWLEPNESLTPVLIAPEDDDWSHYNVSQWERTFALPGDTNSSPFWARAWVVDGRGHRQETGLVKLSLSGPASEEPVSQKPAPRNEHLPWWSLLLIGAPLAAGVMFGLERRSR